MPRRDEFDFDITKLKCPNKYTSKVIEYCLLYQTNLSYFPKPIRYCKGYTVYSLYVGITYLKFYVMTKPTKTAPIFLTISKYEIPKGFGGVEEEPLLTTEISRTTYDYILNDPNAPPILKAVLEAMPRAKDEWADIDHDIYFEYAYYTEIVDQIKDYLESLSAKVD